MKENYKLHYAPDNASMIVRIALEMIGEPYDLELVDRRQSQQRSTKYLSLNPLGMIPALQTHDGVLFETGAILLWLADRHGGVFPAQNDVARADGLKWLFFLSNSLHANLRQMFYPEKFIAPEHADALRNGLAQRITSCVVFDDSAPSILDIYVCACLRWAQLYPSAYSKDWVEVQHYPNLLSLAKRLHAHPAVKVVQREEGLGPTPFTQPTYANPMIGSAT